MDKEKQFIALAYQYLAVDIPYRAAQVLDKAMTEGLVERNEKNLSIFNPRNTFNKMGHFIKPKSKIIKKFNNSWFEKSLQNSINYYHCY